MFMDLGNLVKNKKSEELIKHLLISFSIKKTNQEKNKVTQKELSQENLLLSYLKSAEEVLFKCFPYLYDLYNKYREPFKVILKTNSDKGFGACYNWEQKTIYIWTPEKDITNDKTNLLNLGFGLDIELSRKAIMSGGLIHENFHNVFQNTYKMKHPDIRRVDTIAAFDESFSVLSEYLLIEAVEKDKDGIFTPQEKEDVRKVFRLHKMAYLPKKLEDDPNSKYTEWDDRMLFIKIYQRFGEKGVVDFFKKMNYTKIAGIRKYKENTESKVLTEEYKRLLEMDAETLIKEFSA